jgi:hypothetical protein
VKNLLKKLKWRFFFERLRKAMKILNQHDWFPSHDFNFKTSEYKARILSTHLRYSALFFLSFYFIVFLLFFASLVFLIESQQGTLGRETRRRCRNSWDSSPRSLQSSLQVWQVDLFVTGSKPWTRITALARKPECHFYLVQLTVICQWRELHSAKVVWSKMASLENTLMAIFLLRIKKLV